MATITTKLFENKLRGEKGLKGKNQNLYNAGGRATRPPLQAPIDSLDERLNNSLPRLSRLERSYGERETRPGLWNARHVDLEGAPARPATRPRDRRSDPADVSGHFACRARIALSRPLPPGSSRVDHGRMGRV